jgi:hypothetical protein
MVRDVDEVARRRSRLVWFVWFPAAVLFICGCGLLLAEGESNRLGKWLTVLGVAVSLFGVVLSTWLYPRRLHK